jgi:hypothetical protein
VQPYTRTRSHNACRRKAKENNFKAVLDSIRDLMNEAVVIPPWLHDIFLGYGDPGTDLIVYSGLLVTMYW